jgi:hypothetical protein
MYRTAHTPVLWIQISNDQKFGGSEITVWIQVRIQWLQYKKIVMQVSELFIK